MDLSIQHNVEQSVESTPLVTLPARSAAASQSRIGKSSAAFVVESALLSVEEEQSLSRAWKQSGDTRARSRLIEAHVRLVRSIANTLKNRGICVDDLIGEGNVGLIRAVDRFNPDAGTRLSTFAFAHIRSAMLGLFRQASVRGRLSHKSRRSVANLETVAATLRVEHGCEPSVEQLAEQLDWTADEVARTIRTRDHVMHWRDSLVREIASGSEASDERLTRDEDRVRVMHSFDDAMSVLNPVERTVIELMYGIGAKSRLGATEVAALTQLSPREVRRVKTFAYAKLARHAATRRQ